MLDSPHRPLNALSISPPQFAAEPTARLRPINWNRVEDTKDLEVWNRLTSNFWLPEKVPLSNDAKDWQRLGAEERQATMRLFTGLTLLDTVQATVGEVAQIGDGMTDHEQAVYTNIAFMQSVHARSYSSVFSTLADTKQIDAAYRWAVDNDVLQERAKKCMVHYCGSDKLKRKAASTLLSSLLLYAGFYLPLWQSMMGRMTNTADLVRLILRDKAIHGYYSGYKYQRGLERVDEERRSHMHSFVLELLYELCDLEYRYSAEIYRELGLIDDVERFVRYNANKALMNLGYPDVFSAEETAVNPGVLSALTPGSTENHDFFSGAGSSYVIGKAEVTADEDWMF